MTLELRWIFPSRTYENIPFPQLCELNFDNERKSKVIMPSYCAGAYISNLINACNVEERIEGYKNSRAFYVWARIAGEEYIQQNNTDGNENYILYDSITYPAFCIFKNVQTALTELGKHLNDRNNRGWSSCSRRVFGYEFINEINYGNMQNLEGQVQNKIDGYMEKYNRLLISSTDEKDDDFYDLLCECLRTYDNGKRKLIKEYLKKKGGRCFATFIRRCDGRKYISFSGFFDAEERGILDWLKKPRAEDFVNVAKSICASKNAIFVPVNLQTRRYNVKSPLPFYIEQGLSVGDIIRLNYSPDDYKEHYSCCERKIFGFFNDETPDGTLYVKMKACSECGLGLIYQWSVGGRIILKDGLSC